MRRLEKNINKFKNKAPGSSRIIKIVLENCSPKAIKTLTNIFNACFSPGFFPTKMKKAIIRLIPKENKDPKYPINYRPIFLLEAPGKLYQKVILSRLNAFIVENNIMKDRQHGFRSKRRTTTAIASTYAKLSKSLADKQQMTVVLRDVAKAFDKVWHSGPKYKLLHMGLPDILQKTLCTYLDNRIANISMGT